MDVKLYMSGKKKEIVYNLFAIEVAKRSILQPTNRQKQFLAHILDRLVSLPTKENLHTYSGIYGTSIGRTSSFSPSLLFVFFHIFLPDNNNK